MQISSATAVVPSVPAHPNFPLVKWVEDRVVGSLLMLVFLPLVIAIAIAIRLESPGPIFFRQRRGGLNGKPFKIYKFRTMLREAGLDESVPQARPNDPRLTRIGAFLRRHSLDELPQLINVVRGDMSLVGPRPHALYHDAQFETRCTGYRDRFRVKPGLTGWAQISGYRGLINSDEELQRRVDHDNFYIDHWRPKLELRILLHTLRALLGMANAH